MSKNKLKDLKDEIINLKVNQGMGSRKISKYLKDKYGIDVSDSTLRNTIRKWGYGGDIFTKKLEENDFSLPENWSYGWLKTKEASVFVRNQAEIMTLDDVTNAIKEAVKDIKPIKLPKVSTTNKKALRAVISDAHVGMKSDGKEALFSFEYNEDIFNEHLGILFQSISDKVDAHGDFDLIIIDDLGDGLDGFNGETTRGGHKLPQNMDNKDAWSAYVFGKLETYANIVKLNSAKKYQFRNVTNCNHSGDFGWTANMAIKMAIEQMFDNVEYILLDKPIEHFFFGDHCHLLTHGKDKSLMVRNWSLQLTDKIANLIRQYIDHHDIRSKYIHLDKGDLHSLGFAREPKFDYRNYMSFAPPSQWVQANFGVSYCGFSLQVIPKNSNQVEHTDVFFDMKKV